MFPKYFKGIYSETELRNILLRNVKKVTLIKDYPYGGEYKYSSKEIILKKATFDSTTFHEFIHAIRSEYRKEI